MPAGRANACPMTAEAILNWSIQWRRACMGRTSRSRRNYYCRSHVRKRFHQLDGWIIRRLWSHRAKRLRNTAWKEYPTTRLRTEFKLVGLVSL
jgi:hypothetical protein